MNKDKNKQKEAILRLLLFIFEFLCEKEYDKYEHNGKDDHYGYMEGVSFLSCRKL